MSKPTAAAFLPEKKTLDTLREAAAHCRGCDLYKHSTQTVFGEGLRRAELMLVGEQPGDQEDKQGRPFVGPAGRILDTALERAGIPRDDAYITNVVKHFKWEPRGKRRIHAKPNYGEIAACFPWLEAEAQVVKPIVIVCLGATAAQALLGRQFRVTRDRGRVFQHELAPHIMATVHPSAILRSQTDEERHRQMEDFIVDLKLIAPLLPHSVVASG